MVPFLQHALLGVWLPSLLAPLASLKALASPSPSGAHTCTIEVAVGLNSARMRIIHDVYDFLISRFRSIQVNRETYGQIECTVVFLTLQQ